MKKQATQTVPTYRSASLKHLHYTTVRIGRCSSYSMSFALAFLAPIVSAELLLRCLLDLPRHPLLTVRNLAHWLVGNILVLAAGVIGCVYLVEGDSDESLA